MVRKAGVNLHAVETGGPVFIRPTTGVPLTITNATLASLAPYRSSGLYSDLVNQGDAGPNDMTVENILFDADDNTSYDVELLGVKGDVTADTTNFAGLGGTFSGVAFYHCRLQGVAGLFSKNAGFVTIDDTRLRGIVCENTSWVSHYQGHLTGGSNQTQIDYDPASPDGENALGNFGTTALFTYFGDVILTGEAKFGWTEGFSCHRCAIDRIDADDDAQVKLFSCDVKHDVDCEAAVDFNCTNVRIGTDATFAPGAGLIELDGVEVGGTFTDTSDKAAWDERRVGGRFISAQLSQKSHSGYADSEAITETSAVRSRIASPTAS